MLGGGGVLIALLVVGVVAVLWFVGVYNGLVRLRNQVKNAWSQIDVQLKRRHDLISKSLEGVGNQRLFLCQPAWQFIDFCF